MKSLSGTCWKPGQMTEDTPEILDEKCLDALSDAMLNAFGPEAVYTYLRSRGYDVVACDPRPDWWPMEPDDENL